MGGTPTLLPYIVKKRPNLPILKASPYFLLAF